MQATDRFSPPTRPLLRGAALLLAGSLLGVGAYLSAQVPGAPAEAAKTVGDVVIKGNRHVATEVIRNQMRTKPGQPFRPENLTIDTRNLMDTKQFANVAMNTVDEPGGKVRVIVHISDYQSIVGKITYKGNFNISRDDLDSLTGLRVGAPCNPGSNKAACARIVERYNSEGRPLADCKLEVGGRNGDTEVVFNITEGPKVYVSDIRFMGNKFLDGGVLRNRVNSSRMLLTFIPVNGEYNALKVEADVQDLIRFYRDYGFHDVRVSVEKEYSRDHRTVVLVYHIAEGIRYRLADTPRIEGAKSVPPEQLHRLLSTKPYQHVDERQLKQDGEVIKTWIETTGRPAVVQTHHVYDKDKPGIVQVHYEVAEQKPFRVGQIIIVGNDRTRDNVIRRQIPLYPGQVLSYPELKAAERNLARLGIFEGGGPGQEGVRPTLTVLDNPANPNSEYKDILVTVQETSTGSLMFGVGVSSDSGLTGSIVLNERNFDLFRPPTSFDDFLNGSAFRGAGQEMRIEAVPGTQIQRYMATFREPFLFDSAYSLSVSGYYYQRVFNEYSEERLGGRVTLGRKVSDYWSILGGVRLEDVTVYNLPAGAPSDYTSVQGGNFLAGFNVGATYDRRDSVLMATEGELFSITFEQVTGDRTFPLVNAEFSKYWTVYQRGDGSGRHVVTFHSQAGWAGDNTPVFERYFAGGFRSLRGFEFRGVSPQVNGYQVGGNFLFTNSLEYRVPVVASDAVHLVGFVDSGTVSPKISDIDSYRVSAGFGVRLKVPMLGPVPLALDFGFPIVSGRYDRKQVFTFQMGGAF